jgi:hypothetical protein
VPVCRPKTPVSSFYPFVELDRLNDFAFKYGSFALTYGENIFGPWSGKLSNESERIALEKPPAAYQPGNPIDWIIVDEVTYSDQNPWPEAPDGGGDSLRRINSNQYYSGNDPANWKADITSPGEPNRATVKPPPPP